MLCPSCSARVLPGTTFCALCGAQLAAVPQFRVFRLAPPQRPMASATTVTPVAPVSPPNSVSPVPQTMAAVRPPSATTSAPMPTAAPRPTIAPSPVIAVRPEVGQASRPVGARQGGAGASATVTNVVWVVAAIVLFLLAFGITVLVADSHTGLPLP